MNTKQIALAIGAALLSGIAIGHYSRPAKIVEDTKTNVTDTKATNTAIQEHVQTNKVTVTVKKPDGTVETTETDKSTTDTGTKEATHETDKVATETHKEIINDGSHVYISALAGVDILKPSNGLSYGGSISKDFVLGTTIGVWGLTSGTVGVQLGFKL